MVIQVNYGKPMENADQGTEVSGYVTAPDGTGYDMEIDSSNNTLRLSLSTAMAGNWTVYIAPKSLDILDISVTSDTVAEDTICEEMVFDVSEDTTYQLFYADIIGDGDVYGSIIGPNGITYNFELKNMTKKTKRDFDTCIISCPM